MLDINYEFRKGILFIRLFGELTRDTSFKLKREITDMIEDNGITNVVFNITKLSFIDDFGINDLLKNLEICKSNNGVGLLCGINKHVNLIHCDKILQTTIIDDELSAFNKIIV